MRFLAIYKSSLPEGAPRPNPNEMADMMKLIEEMKAAGTLLATEGCQPSSKGARVRLADGKIAVTDGPFTEAKELIGGFAILEANSKDHAIQLSERFLHIAGDGETEIRLLYSGPDDGSTPAALKGS